MSDIAIKVENLSKLYQLGTVGTGTLRNDLQRWWSTIRGEEDPFAKIGQVNDRTKKAESEFVWALKDIDFEVKKGEVLGIIGRNGAGKSTLLKILSKITSASTGKIMVDGRIASLLEVGTGFHPELTGRENIFMNGAILGMRKWEIQKKFDAIVDFSGVEAYIDTPVKRYSSGMYVRLAFAVAAFLEPEILIVDEVLSVGDAEFQKKCLGRMKEVSVNEGRTVLFVSHNIAAIKKMCNRGLLLEKGSLLLCDKINDVIELYNDESTSHEFADLIYKQIGNTLTTRISIVEIILNNQNSGIIKLDYETNYLCVRFQINCIEDSFVAIEARFSDESGVPLACFSSSQTKGETRLYKKGFHTLEEIIQLPVGIMKGKYIFSLFLTHPEYETYFILDNKIILEHSGFPTATGNILEYKSGNGWFMLS